jgi:UDP-glucose 4-epimerase
MTEVRRTKEKGFLGMAILVTGGAGYIGSATVELLRQNGEEVVVLDNLCYGHRAAVDGSTPFYEGDIGDSELVGAIARKHGIEACIHFAAFAYVGESVEQPGKYFENNTAQTLALLESLRAAGTKKFIFSSTCATYGEPQYVPLDEAHPQHPANPYGWSKFMVERILESYDRAYDFKFVALRYFNAAGAMPGDVQAGSTPRGEDHDPETHLIPLILQVALDQREQISVFGSDYPTPDGTAIRDYIHIEDLGQAHLLALEHLRRGGQSEFINLGNGAGYSVLEVIEMVRKVSGQEIPTKMEARRAGDPSRLIAKANKAREVLGWQPKHPDLESIIRSAWQWHNTHPHGYGK